MLGALVCGAGQPIFGGFLMAKILAILSIPLEYFPYVFPGKSMEDETNYNALMMGVIAVATGIAMFVQKYSFSILSESVTYNMRYTLYDSILS